MIIHKKAQIDFKSIPRALGPFWAMAHRPLPIVALLLPYYRMARGPVQDQGLWVYLARPSEPRGMAVATPHVAGAPCGCHQYEYCINRAIEHYEL